LKIGTSGEILASEIKEAAKKIGRMGRKKREKKKRLLFD